MEDHRLRKRMTGLGLGLDLHVGVCVSRVGGAPRGLNHAGFHYPFIDVSPCPLPSSIVGVTP